MTAKPKPLLILLFGKTKETSLMILTKIMILQHHYYQFKDSAACANANADIVVVSQLVFH